MLVKTALALVATAALADQVIAHSAHRHMHRLARKDVRLHTEIVVVTEWQTVTVTEGDEPASTRILAANRPTRQYSPALPTSDAPAPSAAPAAAPPVEVPAPAPVPTTLAVQVRPAPEVPAPVPVPAPAPVVEQPPPRVEQPAPAAPAPATGAGGGKRGLAYNDAGLVNTFFTGGNSCPSCGWAYNWDSADNGLSRQGLNFVPMLWGTNPIHTSRWNKNADNMLAKGTTHMLSFNEPDFPAQSNLSPDEAAAGHVQWMNPYAGRAKIGAPAITNSNIPGQGLDWLRSFVQACNRRSCAIDFCVTHWYSPADAAQTLFDHIKQVHEICGGKPVWLTEFAPFGSDGQISNFLSTNLPKLDSLPYLERYSYFMVNPGSLLSSGNSLSSYGKVYASA